MPEDKVIRSFIPQPAPLFTGYLVAVKINVYLRNIIRPAKRTSKKSGGLYNRFSSSYPSHKSGAKKVKTSIIIVNFNSRPYLAECLKSLLANTGHTPLEIIIIDNASTDDSRAFCKSLTDLRIKLIINQKNFGYAQACNQGLKVATGEWLVTMNPDVILPPNWLTANGLASSSKPQNVNRWPERNWDSRCSSRRNHQFLRRI